MLEHLSYKGSISALTEAYRTIKPGGYIRIIVPSLDKYLSYCNGKSPNEEFNKFTNCALAISVLTQNAGHSSVYDYSLLSSILLEIGWKDVKQVSFQEGSDSNLFYDHPERDWASVYVEAMK